MWTEYRARECTKWLVYLPELNRMDVCIEQMLLVPVMCKEPGKVR